MEKGDLGYSSQEVWCLSTPENAATFVTIIIHIFYRIVVSESQREKTDPIERLMGQY